MRRSKPKMFVGPGSGGSLFGAGGVGKQSGSALASAYREGRMRPFWIIAALAAVFFAQAAQADDSVALGKACAAANSQDAVDACAKLINGGTL